MTRRGAGTCSGLIDKLYWRETSPGRFHCFTRGTDRKYHSLCGPHELTRIGGQACNRPRPVERCGRCDGLEAERRGWEESAA
jgi:hypothetical protein